MRLVLLIFLVFSITPLHAQTKASCEIKWDKLRSDVGQASESVNNYWGTVNSTGHGKRVSTEMAMAEYRESARVAGAFVGMTFDIRQDSHCASRISYSLAKQIDDVVIDVEKKSQCAIKFAEMFNEYEDVTSLAYNYSSGTDESSKAMAKDALSVLSNQWLKKYDGSRCEVDETMDFLTKNKVKTALLDRKMYQLDGD